MKIFFVVVCFALTRVLKANDLKEIESNGVNDVIVSKIIQGLNHIKSAKCKSDLNYTTNAFNRRESWAVASKNEFCASYLHSQLHFVFVLWSAVIERGRICLLIIHQPFTWSEFKVNSLHSLTLKIEILAKFSASRRSYSWEVVHQIIDESASFRETKFMSVSWVDK